MRAWAYLMGGLIIWAVHFFAAYIIASIFLTSTTARLLAIAVTLACLAAAAILFRVGWRRRRDDRLDAWIDKIAAWSGAAAFVAVLWQGLPALLI